MSQTYFHFMLFISWIISKHIINVIAQYSVTEHFKSSELGAAVPGVFFFYDISPIKVRMLSFAAKLHKNAVNCYMHYVLQFVEKMDFFI